MVQNAELAIHALRTEQNKLSPNAAAVRPIMSVCAVVLFRLLPLLCVLGLCVVCVRRVAHHGFLMIIQKCNDHKTNYHIM